MIEYPKINTVWKRDDRGRIVVGDYATPEFAYLADAEWEWTEKVDGTNVRVAWDGARVEFGGRTDNAQMPTKLLAALTAMFTPERLAAAVGDGPAVLFGEGYGAGIQSGGLYQPTQGFVLFDVMIGPWWLHRPDVADVGAKLELRVVPVIGRMSLMDACEVVRAGLQSAWGDFAAEGLVGRPLVDLFDRKGERIMAKIKHKDYARLEQR